MRRKVILVLTSLVALLQLVASAPAWAAAPRIAYRIYGDYGDPDHPGIYTMEPDGSDKRRLTGHKTDSGPQWSPDRSMIAFVRSGPQSRPLSFPRRGPYLWVMDADGSNKRYLASLSRGRSFTWSPDGDRIAFTADRAIHIIEPSGEGRRTIFRGYARQLAWAPDGRAIAFTGFSVLPSAETASTLSEDIYKVEVDSGETSRLTSHDGSDFDPAWSPDGRLIAFASTRDQFDGGEGPYTSNIFVMDADGGKERQLVDDCQWKGGIMWTPDSDKIVYQSAPDDDGCGLDYMGRGGLNILDLSSGSRRVMKVGSDPILDPRGRWIAFSAPSRAGRGDVEIYKVAFGGGRWVRLTRTGPGADEIVGDW